MKKWFLLILSCAILITASLYHITASTKNNIELPPLPTADSCLVLPLDDRPPCTDFVHQLGTLAGIKVTLPPRNLLGHYEIPAPKEKLKEWLKSNAPQNKNLLLATDLLAYGGLMQSRLTPLTSEQSQSLFSFLTQLRRSDEKKPFYVYSIIPRLLVSDQLIPDSWYQWHLMRWSILEDKKSLGIAYNQEEHQAYQKEIPPEILQKYLHLYATNADFNNKLIALAAQENITELIIGQDDAQQYGLSNKNRIAAADQIKTLSGKHNYHVTQGADELGQMAIAKMYAQQNNCHPRVYVEFSTPSAADYILHFVPLRLEDIIKDKISLLNGQQVTSDTEADFLLFVHCGREKHTNYQAIADRVKKLCSTKPVALVDLSYNFEAAEALLPYLLKNSTPLTKLVAYAGWNTASNSIGSALSQATVFMGQKKRLPSKLLPSLYAKNLEFNCARFLDDYVYQKLIRHKLTFLQNFEGVTTEKLGQATVWAERYLNLELSFYNKFFLIANLSRQPFYETPAQAYYLKGLDFTATLPWQRVFEIQLTVIPQYILKQKV